MTQYSNEMYLLVNVTIIASDRKFVNLATDHMELKAVVFDKINSD